MLEFGPPLEKAGLYHALARQVTADTPTGRPVRVAVLSTYTAEFVKAALQVELAKVRLAPTLFFGGFGQLESLVFDGTSALYEFQPDVVVLAVRLEDIAPDATGRIASPDGRALRDTAIETIDRLVTLTRGVQSHRACVVLAANFAMPDPPLVGIGDSALASSHARIFADANEQLRAAVEPIGGCHVWDYAGLVRSRGAEQWTDPRLWYLARIPVRAEHHGWYAQHLARTVRAALQPSAKVLVLDLDNTLWGGVLGDDGINGLVIGDEYPGSEFKALQRRILALRDRGILLVLSSKNDTALAEEAFRTHPEMLLRWSDFAAHRVNWGPKSRGMVEMADELNLGLDAFVFLDDNPLEQAEVRASAPAVKVLDWAPWGSMNRALAHCAWFDTLATSAEDFSRAEMYARDRERREVAAQYQNVDDFLRSLEMHVSVEPTAAMDRERVAQLIGKTNQFNLTGRRYSSAELVAVAEHPANGIVAHLRLRDRFGEQGLVAAAVLRREEQAARIDVFVMSCRVMNRHVEHALIAYLAETARRWECTTLVGEYVPSPRNKMVSTLFADLGFAEQTGAADAPARTWSIPVTHPSLAWPNLIARDPS